MEIAESTQRQRPPGLLLSQRAAADFLGVSPRTLRRMIEAGAIRPIMVPGLGRVRFRRVDLEEVGREAAP